MIFISNEDDILISIYLIPKFIFQLVLNLGREDKLLFIGLLKYPLHWNHENSLPALLF